MARFDEAARRAAVSAESRMLDVPVASAPDVSPGCAGGSIWRSWVSRSLRRPRLSGSSLRFHHLGGKTIPIGQGTSGWYRKAIPAKRESSVAATETAKSVAISRETPTDRFATMSLIMIAGAFGRHLSCDLRRGVHVASRISTDCRTA